MKFASLVMASIIPTLLKGCRVEDGDQLYGFPMRKVDSDIDGVDNLISDSLLPEKWYRTVHMGKQFLLLDINGAENWNLTYGMCGTYYPIYLKDPHPDTATLTNEPVQVTACTLNLNMACLTAYTIYIRKCGKEVQYLLTSSIPYGGYCFDEGQTLYDPINWPAPGIDDVGLGQISITTRVVHTTRPAGPFGLQYSPTTHFVCQFNMKPTYFYTVNWYIDGNYLTTTGPSTDSMELSLTETTIMNAVRPGFTMGKKKISQCTGDVQSTADCSNVLTSLTADGTFEPAEIRFPIVTVDIDYNDKSVFDIDLRFGSHTSPLWHNYVLPSVRVQQKTKPCNNARAMCACGVAVRAGKDVFMINRCGSIHYIDFVHCGEGGILDVLEINSEKYRVLTPIGTRIEIRLYGGSYEGTMNIDIYMAPKDFNSIEGLCGTFDNDVNNDFWGSNGQQLPNEKDFAESWRMDSDTQNTVLKEKNLFINPDRSLQSWKERNHLYCFCQSGAASCSSTQYYMCSFPNNITPLKCHVSKGNRKKRGTDSHMKELRRLFDLMNSVDPPMHYLYKRQAGALDITAEDAYKACTALINGSLAVQSYSDLSALENPHEVINNCAYDVEVGGTLVWANAHVESYNDLVKNMIDLQPEYAANNTERIDVFLANTCPSNCTGNGNCTLANNGGEGVCVCDTFYHGADCSIDERDPLIIDDIETGGKCDTAERSDDCQCFAIRSGAILRSIRCNVKTFKISIHGKEELVSEYRSNGSYEDIFTGVCCSNHNKYDVDAFAVKYEVSASNGGSNFGNIKSVFVFDSTCQKVAHDETGRDGTVVLNTTSGCFIENRCYSDGEVSPFNTCLRCNSAVSATGWSEAPCTTTTVSTKTATIRIITEEPTTAEPTTTTVEPTTTTAEPTTTTAEPSSTTTEDSLIHGLRYLLQLLRQRLIVQ
ncbi:VWDE-like protein [Mya arenaria]|uniref:VWDE-like protein n=1 Tax=Mya arenaria TaxID=6604 RepID=A0ABY7DZ16_MYAAR|nr:VWDE-like protein [Mya arenaria]